MTGTIALLGGAPFTGNDDLDRQLLADTSADRVVVLPTADAFEGPDALVSAAQEWATRLGVAVDPLMVLRRTDALDDANASVVRAARAVYLVGDSSMHLRSVLKDTPLFDALRAVIAADGVVVGVGASAAALCDPMTDQRGGAFTLGLGLVAGLAVLTGADSLSDDSIQRSRKLAAEQGVTMIELPAGSAALLGQSGWRLVGDAVAHGDLPD